jgi:hypothetical protein
LEDTAVAVMVVVDGIVGVNVRSGQCFSQKGGEEGVVIKRMRVEE